MLCSSGSFLNVSGLCELCPKGTFSLGGYSANCKIVEKGVSKNCFWWISAKNNRIHIIYDCHQDTTTPSRGRHHMNYALSPCFLVRLTVLQVSVACVFNQSKTLKSSFFAKEGSQCPAGFFFNQNSCEPVPSGRCRCNELTSHRCSQ